MTDHGDLNQIADDFAGVDPSLCTGYEKKYEADIEVYHVKEGQMKTSKLRLLSREEGDQTLEVRIEVMDDDDINFFFVGIINRESFDLLHDTYNLRIDFDQLVDTISSLIDKRKDGKTSSSFSIETQMEESQMKLSFLQNLKTRSVTLMTFTLEPAPEDFIRSQAQFRFSRYRMELEKKRHEYDMMCDRLRSKNKSVFNRVLAKVAEQTQSTTS